MSEAQQPQQGVITIKNDQMITVTKSFFIDGMVLSVPVYLKIKDDNYLMIGKKGDKTNFTNLHSFKNPLSFVFVKKEDHSKLIHHMTDVTEKVISSTSVAKEIKNKFVLGLTETAISSFDGKGFGTMAQLQKVSGYIVKLNESISHFDDVLKLLQEMTDEESRHATTTSIISLMICEEMQLTHKAAQEKLALGCLLHDIGLKYIQGDFIGKPKHKWTVEENELYQTHPVKGAEMLRDFKDISNDVLLIISEHHENSVGTGFPRKLRDIKISPLGRIAALADCFSDLLFSRMDLGNSYTSDGAIKYIEEILGQPFHKPAFLALKNVINKKFLQDKAKAA